MGERQEREWVAMTPGDFDREAPLVLNVGTGPATVPAEPDEYGTAPLFGETAPVRPAPRRNRRGRPAPAQERLF
ncbi:hypothetical protein ACH4NS_14485 [Streptomyces mutabilis]|uniref:hypothetical protein n=1 Tax=Streptomyces TaxID=1883 RepID=UPI000BC37C0B|nr:MULTISPECIES: hypothetical protein [unclassified Streptomyces]MDG9688860.1 hypothetical protein [Streptomyces sp. DH17]MDN3248721.1 hypothetical protein [Streptomyces sp. ZSW22]MDN3256709.1 hypothetical protein [Streptomyces sp. MA25(2023)]MDQ0383576.1 hypothetical protein [Streptomyces sp. DSM 42143]PAM98217.1 hypothetical protein CJI59_29960 [Streptomyces sp. Alain-F2R5]